MTSKSRKKSVSRSAKRGSAKPTKSVAGRPTRKSGPPPAQQPVRPAAQPKKAALAHGPGLKIQPGGQLLYLSASHVQQLPWEKLEIFHHVQLALRELGRGKAEKPPQISLYPQRESLLSATAAFVPNMQACGLKWFASFPNNHNLKLPQVSSMILLADPHTGFPIAVMESGWMVGQRGPAVSAVAAKLLARQGATKATIVGAGVQGRGHIPALKAVIPGLEIIFVYDTDAAQAAKAVKWARTQGIGSLSVTHARDLYQAVSSSDIIVSATCVREKPQATIRAEWLRSGALMLPLDLDSVFEPAVFEQADRFYVDSLDDLKSLHEKGLFIKAMPTNVTGQLGQLVAGLKSPGRGAPAERIVCLNTGAGSVDVVLARAVFDKACRLGVGQVLDL